MAEPRPTSDCQGCTGWGTLGVHDNPPPVWTSAETLEHANWIAEIEFAGDAFGDLGLVRLVVVIRLEGGKDIVAHHPSFSAPKRCVEGCALYGKTFRIVQGYAPQKARTNKIICAPTLRWPF